MKDDRTEHLAARFTPREAKMIKRVAGKQGMGPSEYVRAAVMMMTVLDGDREALAITADLARQKFAELWRPALHEAEEPA